MPAILHGYDHVHAVRAVREPPLSSCSGVKKVAAYGLHCT
jgi:hypothetical protein